jgi:uncharacterized protein YgbK (DUF1537 family)
MAQPTPTARQCTAVLTGVLIRHGVPISESLTADLTAVITSREAALLEYLAERARIRVEQVLVHNVRSGGFRDGLTNAATWLSRTAAAAAHRDTDVVERQRALQRLRGPRAAVADDGTPTRPRNAAASA